MVQHIPLQHQSKVVLQWAYVADSPDWYIIKMNLFLLNQFTKSFILLKSLGPNIIVTDRFDSKLGPPMKMRRFSIEVKFQVNTKADFRLDLNLLICHLGTTYAISWTRWCTTVLIVPRWTWSCIFRSIDWHLKRQRHVVYRRSAILSKEDQKDEDDERICTQNGHGPSDASTSSHRWTHRPQASSYEPPLERRTRQYTTHAQRYNRYNRQRWSGKL